MFEDGVVLCEVLEVAFVLLGDNGIEETASFVTTLFDELIVLGTDHDQGDKTYMVNEAFVVFFAASEGLFHAAFDATSEGLFAICALYHCHFFAVGDILAVRGSESRFGEGKEVDGIEQIGLALSVESDETIELVREGK